MSLEETIKSFFAQTKENKQQKQQEEVIYSLALAACEDKHNVLIECYKTTWVGGCQTEMDKFWKCVNEQKVILSKKVKSFQQNADKQEQFKLSEDR